MRRSAGVECQARGDVQQPVSVGGVDIGAARGDHERT
jgi:hypothetical protein